MLTQNVRDARHALAYKPYALYLTLWATDAGVAAGDVRRAVSKITPALISELFGEKV